MRRGAFLRRRCFIVVFILTAVFQLSLLVDWRRLAFSFNAHLLFIDSISCLVNLSLYLKHLLRRRQVESPSRQVGGKAWSFNVQMLLRRSLVIRIMSVTGVRFRPVRVLVVCHMNICVLVLNLDLWLYDVLRLE